MIDYGYYHNSFCGRYGEEIVPYLKRAYHLIKCCILRGVQDSEIADSVCIQAEYMYQSDGFADIRIGDLSGTFRERGTVCREALMYLENDGLLYRGGII